MSDGGPLGGDVRLRARLRIEGEGEPVPLVEAAGARLNDGREHPVGGAVQVEGCREEERIGRELPREECPARRIALEAECHLGLDRGHPWPLDHLSRYRRERGTDAAGSQTRSSPSA